MKCPRETMARDSEYKIVREGRRTRDVMDAMDMRDGEYGRGRGTHTMEDRTDEGWRLRITRGKQCGGTVSMRS